MSISGHRGRRVRGRLGATDGQRGSSASGVAWAAAVCAIAAFFVDFGPIHQYHCSDSLITILVSLMRWTPFYWAQDRFGMLVPALALPFRDPLANLLVQTFLTTGLGLLALFLLPLVACPRAGWFAAGAVSAATFLACEPLVVQAEYLGTAQPYGTSLGVGALGLFWLFRGQRPGFPPARIVGILLVVVSLWVNPAAAFAFVPLIAVRWWLEGGRGWRLGAVWKTDYGRALMVIAVGLAISMLGALATHPPRYRPLTPREWLVSWVELARGASALYLTPSWRVVAVIAACGAGIAVLMGKASSVVRALPLVAGAAGIFIVMGMLNWPKMNAFSPRYVLPAVLLLQTALVQAALVPLAERWGRRGRRILALAGAVLVLGAAVVVHGPPSLGRVLGDLDRTMGSRTAEILSEKCTHVIGNYRTVWPMVFHARLVLARQGDLRPVWGIAYRCNRTQKMWRRVPLGEVRLAAALDDPEAVSVAREYRLPPLRVAKRGRTILVYRPVAAENPADSALPWAVDRP